MDGPLQYSVLYGEFKNEQKKGKKYLTFPSVGDLNPDPEELCFELIVKWYQVGIFSAVLFWIN